MKLKNTRELAYVSSRVDANLMGAASTAAHFELGKEMFLKLAENAYDGMVDLFGDADARDAANAKQMRDLFAMIPDPELDRAFENIRVLGEDEEEEDDDDESEEEEGLTDDPIDSIEIFDEGLPPDLKDDQVYRTQYGVAYIEHVEKDKGEVDFVWLTGRYSGSDELRVDHTTFDYFRGSDLLYPSLRDYQMTARPEIRVGQVWKILDMGEHAGISRVVVTEVLRGYVSRVRFRWIEGGFANDVYSRDDSATKDFLYAHGYMEKNVPPAVEKSVWSGNGGRIYALTTPFAHNDGGTGWQYSGLGNQVDEPGQWIRDEYFTGDFRDSIFQKGLKQRPLDFLGYEDDPDFQRPQ